MSILFVMQGKCLFYEISRAGDWGGGGGGGGGGGAGAPDLPLENYKLSYISKQKLVRTSLEKQPPDGVVWIRTHMSDGGILFFIFLFCMYPV